MTAAPAVPIAKRVVPWLALSTVGLVALVFLTPPDRDLGAVVRLLIFHGASTWVNLAAFAGAAVAAVWFLVKGSRGAFVWASSLRYVALGLWLINTFLGLLSMDLVWGGIRWGEPRLQMTFWILLASMLTVGVDLVFGHDRLTALLDVGIVALVAYLAFGAEQVFHPDSPVFSSGARIISLFLGQVALIAVLVGLVAWMIATWIRLESDRRDHAIEV